MCWDELGNRKCGLEQLTKRLKEDGHGATTAAHGILKTGFIDQPCRERTAALNSTTGTRMTKDGMTLSVTKLLTLFVPELFVQVSQSI